MIEYRTKDFKADCTDRNLEEAKSLKWWILTYLDKHTHATADELYEHSECGDMALYLALHELVIRDLIEGMSPYDVRRTGNHRDWQYRRAMNNQAMFFTAAAESMSWNPKEWDDDDESRGEAGQTPAAAGVEN